MNLQRNYWQIMIQIKAQAIYLDNYVLHLEKWNDRFNKLLLITSSGSVVGWAGWRLFNGNIYLDVVFSTYIILLQALTVWYFAHNYTGKIKSVSSLRNELDTLFLISKREWHRVSNGLLTEIELNKLIDDIETRKLNALNSSFPDTSLRLKRELKSQADEEAKDYITKHFF